MNPTSRALLAAACVWLSVGTGGGQPPGPPVPPAKSPATWVTALKDQKDKLGCAAARKALGPDGPFPQAAIAALIDALAEQDPPGCDEVTATLADHGQAAVPGLLGALSRPDARVRIGAIKALGRVRPKPVNAAPALIAALKDVDGGVRSAAATALGGLSAAAEVTVPALVVALGDPDFLVRAHSAEALGSLVRLVRKPGPAVVALARAVTDDFYSVRVDALWALRRTGPAAREAVPILIEALGDGSDFPLWARVGLAYRGPWQTAVVGTAATLPFLLDGLDEDRNPSPRAMAAWCLAEIGGAKEAIPQLVRALRAPDRLLRKAAAAALGALGPDAAGAVPPLLVAAACKTNWARWGAIEALGKIGPPARTAVPLLVQELGASDPFMRMTVAEALGGIGPDARESVTHLTKIAQDRQGDHQLREYAAKAVARIDPAFAAKEGLEFAHLDIRLGRAPAVTPRQRPVTADQTKRAKALIAKLAAVDKPDFGLSATMNGHTFAPLPGRGQMAAGLLTDHKVATAHAFRELVEMGPAALPSLLEALDDRGPTKLKIKPFQAGGLFFGDNIPRNPFNIAEKRSLAVKPTEEDGDDELSREYTVRVGDVCFVAIGQIVGRPYQAIQYIPTAIVSIHSPTESKTLRDRVRAAWASNDPAKTLLDSLLTDYATEGIFNGSSLDGWSEGSDYQIEAIVRLLYYFPDETAPLIAARLRSLDVTARPGNDGWIQRDVKNGARTLEIIQAVGWCRAAPIRDALSDMARRTDDPVLREAIAAVGK